MMNYTALLKNLVIAGSAGGAISTIDIPTEYMWIRAMLVAIAACILGATTAPNGKNTNKLPLPGE